MYSQDESVRALSDKFCLIPFNLIHSVGKFYENVNFLDQFCTQKLKRSMESDEKSSVRNSLSFRMMPSKIRLSFFIIEIIAFKDKLLFDKNIKIGNSSFEEPENIWA